MYKLFFFIISFVLSISCDGITKIDAKTQSINDIEQVISSSGFADQNKIVLCRQNTVEYYQNDFELRDAIISGNVCKNVTFLSYCDSKSNSQEILNLMTMLKKKFSTDDCIDLDRQLHNTKVLKLDYNTEGPINLSPLTNLIHIEEMYIESDLIKSKYSLKPISNLSSLKHLYIKSIPQTDENIEFLPNSLISLELSSYNDILDFKFLRHLKLLEKVDIHAKKTLNIDVLGNFNLTELKLKVWTDATIENFYSWIGNLKSLKKLSLSANIENQKIDFLSDLLNLEYLDLSTNGIPKEILNHQGIKKLRFITLRMEGVEDFSIFSESNQLEEVWINGTELKNLDFLSNKMSIKILDLGKNNISDLSPISNLIGIESLRLNNNKIADLSPISNLVKIKNLDLSENLVSNISPLSTIANLLELNLTNNSVADLTALTNLVQLKTLELSSNPVIDLSPIAGLENLEFLALDRPNENRKYICPRHSASMRFSIYKYCRVFI